MLRNLSVPLQMSKLAWRNVLRNWRHSIATIMSIALGFASVSIFDGFLKDLKERNSDGYIHRAMLGHVVVEKSEASKYAQDDQWKYSLTKSDQEFLEHFLKNDPAFLTRSRTLYVTGMASNGEQSAVFLGLAIDPKEGAQIRGPKWEWNTLAGIPIHLSPPLSLNVGTGMGRGLGCESIYQGSSLFLPYGNYVPQNRPFTCSAPRIYLSVTTEAAQINVIDLKVQGIYDAGFREADKRSILLSLEDAHRLYDTDKISHMGILLKDEALAPAFITRLRQAIADQKLAIEVMPWIEHRSAAFVSGGFQILNVFRNLFMIIIVAIGVMSVANTMMKAVNERIREIGTLRSLGFLRSDIMYMFAFEGLYLSLIACVIGLILTIVICYIVDVLKISYNAGIMSVPLGLNIKLAPEAWIISAILLSLLATSTAWYCARRSVRMVVADALRHI